MNRLPIVILRICVAAISLSAATVACKYPPEASFELANESRLPTWFNLPPEVGRANVSVTMKYYVRPTGRCATFTLYDRKDHILGEINGTLRGSTPISVEGLTDRDSGYPSFEVITAQGVSQLIEHKRMEPKFYVVDNPTLLKTLIDGPLNGNSLPSPSSK